MQTYRARLMPYDRKRAHTMRTFVLGNLRFDAGAWIDVDAQTAAILRAVHQSYYDALSPPAFEVCERQVPELDASQVATVASQVATVADVVSSVPDDASISRKSEKKGRF